MTEDSSGAVTRSRPARVRALLQQARHEEGVERFWSFAVAIQLLEEHLADLTTSLPDGRQRASRIIAARRRLARLHVAIRTLEAAHSPR